LERTGDFRVCVEAADAAGAVEGAKRERPDVCLLDINMPGNGIAAATQITGALPDTSVVMLTVSRQDEDLFDALRAGASGYLLKGLDEATIGDALQRVLAGEATLPGTLVARLVDEFRDREHRRVAVPEGQAARLTGREWDVLELMRKGAGTAEISERLFVSPTTVHSAQARRADPGGCHPAARRGGGTRADVAYTGRATPLLAGGPTAPVLSWRP
jgi:DNA-binding NarL/FixJ family response regulator